MKKELILIGLCVLLVLVSGCEQKYYSERCGYFTDKYHEADVEHLGQKLCEAEGCNYYSFEDICETGRVADRIICDCIIRTTNYKIIEID